MYKLEKYRNKLMQVRGGGGLVSKFTNHSLDDLAQKRVYKREYLRLKYGGTQASTDNATSGDTQYYFTRPFFTKPHYFIDNNSKEEMINAAKAGNGKKIRELVEKYGYLITRHLYGYTALYYIAMYAPKTQESGEAITSLVNAVKNVGHEVDINRASETEKLIGVHVPVPTLEVAYHANNLHVMRALVKHGAVYNKNDERDEEAQNLPERTPEVVFLMNYEEAKEEMLDAAEKGDVKKIRELVEKYGPSIATVELGNDKYTALHYIAGFAPNKQESGEAITYLIENVTGIQIDATTGLGGVGEHLEVTPLHLASINGNIFQVEALLINGADSTVENYFGNKPTDVICEDIIETIKIIFEKYSFSKKE